MDASWAKIKKSQANDADRLAAVASGIGEYGLSNACYRLADILRGEAADLTRPEQDAKVGLDINSDQPKGTE